jgi:hypothetical protein
MQKIVCALALVSMASAAAAAAPPTLNIAVDGADDSAARCGLDPSSIESQIALTLRANGIRVSEKLTNPHLYVNLNFSVLPGDICSGSIAVAVEGYSDDDLSGAALGEFQSRKDRVTQLCSAGGSVAHTLNAEAGRDFLADLEALIKTCIGKLDY